MVIKYRFSEAFVTLAFFQKYQLSQSQLYLQVTKKLSTLPQKLA